MENQIGFSEAEAIYFGNIVQGMMVAKEGRKKVKKAKKSLKMKRVELLTRLLAYFLLIAPYEPNVDSDEFVVLLLELRRVVK